MNPILDVEPSLPPGLWLPTAEEPTEQYRKEVFNHPNHPYEDIVDYGAFVVALAMLGNEDGSRSSFMPNQADLVDMNHVGYGITPKMLARYPGGLPRLQHTLGFYPKGYLPDRDELLTRFRWIAGYAIDMEPQGKAPIRSIHKIVSWGVARDLLPIEAKVYAALDGDVSEVRKIFHIEKPNAREQVSYLDLYRFGAQVICENGGPISQVELDEKYADAFIEKPYSVIRALWGSYSNFWLEYGYVDNAHGLSKQQLVNLGIRYAIENDGARLVRSTVDRLSGEQRFPSMEPITRHFGPISCYTQEVAKGYEVFLRTRQELELSGVSSEMVSLACRRFEPTVEFEAWLKEYVPELVVLSAETYAAKYVRRIIKNGFNIDDRNIFDIQVANVKYKLRRLGFLDDDQFGFVYQLIPRFIGRRT